MSIDAGTIIIAFIAAAILAKAVVSGKEARKIENEDDIEDFLRKN